MTLPSAPLLSILLITISFIIKRRAVPLPKSALAMTRELTTAQLLTLMPTMYPVPDDPVISSTALTDARRLMRVVVEVINAEEFRLSLAGMQWRCHST